MKVEAPAGASSPGPAPTGRRRLFWRVYLHGVLLLILVAIATAGAAWVTGQRRAWQTGPERLAVILASELAPMLAEPERLRERLSGLQVLLEGDLSLYGWDGALIASAGDTPLAPLTADQLSDLARKRHQPYHGSGQWVLAMALPMDAQPRAYLLLGHRARAAQAAHLATVILAVLAALALGSWPLARTITRPLERLTATARRLAAGDLTARTALKRTDEVGQLAAAMDEMADQLQSRIRAEKELLANVSHELRTPLTRLRMALELASEDAAPGTTVDAAAMRQRLSGVAGDIGELEQLVDDILTFTRLELAGAAPGGSMPLRREPTLIQDLLRSAVEQLDHGGPHAPIQTVLQADVPAGEVDPMLIRRVFVNLLDNALKHGAPDQPVMVEVTHQAGVLSCAVVDHGPGVSAEQLPRLFEPFFRAPVAAEKSTGIGLGLTLCQRIVQAHGGTISARASQPHGLTVDFTLPW